MVNYTKLAFENAPVGLVISENRIIKCCNSKFSSMLGYTPKDIKANPFECFMVQMKSLKKFNMWGSMR